jgi:hypothetical protein
MNRGKIEKAIKQIDTAMTSIDSYNFPAFKDEELNYNGYGVSVNFAQDKIESAYQTLEDLYDELQEILVIATQNNE